MPKKSKIGEIENISREQIIEMQDNILENYEKADKTKPILLLLKICKGFYGKLIISAIFCVLQLSVMLVMPIVTANAIDAITVGGENALKKIIINLSIAIFLIIINFKKNCIFLLTIPILGIISQLLMAFSPTIYASGYRTGTIMYISFVFIDFVCALELWKIIKINLFIKNKQKRLNDKNPHIS